MGDYACSTAPKPRVYKKDQTPKQELSDKRQVAGLTG